MKSPEHCNQGIWYFGAKIAGSNFGVNPDKINDVHYIKDLLREHIAILNATSLAAKKFESENL